MTSDATGSVRGFQLQPWLELRQKIVEHALAEVLAGYAGRVPERLHEAMRYAVLGGGKRLRPVLAIAAAETLGAGPEGAVLDFACAVEFVHCYSLVHDDLPAMDDDDLRRGRPTCHKVFGEAMAILAGDALLTEAFALLARRGGALAAELCGALAAAAGAVGMVGGQADDMREQWPAELGFLESLHRRKTGALIAVACAGGARAAGADAERVAAFERYGHHLGLAFQIADDLMDVGGDPVKMGKSRGNDARNGKVNFPALVGATAARERARAEARLAREALGPRIGPGLAALADYAAERDR